MKRIAFAILTVCAAPGIRRPAVMLTETRCASGDERQH
jgi:hypothetical protein